MMSYFHWYEKRRTYLKLWKHGNINMSQKCYYVPKNNNIIFVFPVLIKNARNLQKFVPLFWSRSKSGSSDLNLKNRNMTSLSWSNIKTTAGNSLPPQKTRSICMKQITRSLFLINYGFRWFLASCRVPGFENNKKSCTKSFFRSPKNKDLDKDLEK